MWQKLDTHLLRSSRVLWIRIAPHQVTLVGFLIRIWRFAKDTYKSNQEQARWSTHTLGSDIVRHRCLAKLHSAVLHNTTSTLLGATNYKQHVGMLLSYEVICHFESNSQLLRWESGRFSRCALLLTLVPLVVSHEVGTRDQLGSWWFLDIQWETSEPKNSKEISFLTTLEMLQFLDVCKITRTKKTS